MTVGSFSKNQQKKGSDVDLVYEKIDPKTFDILDRLEVKNFLEKKIKHEVDLISLKYTDPTIKKNILSSYIKIF